MKTGLDFKSMLIGALLAACVSLLAGATLKHNAELAVDRFQIRLNENQVFVIDSVTGQVWRHYASAPSGGAAGGFLDVKLRSAP